MNKKKETTIARDFLGANKLAKINLRYRLLFGFHQGFNAARAKHFTDHASIFHHADSLKVRTEGSSRSFLRPGTIVTEARLFSTVCTLRHFIIPFRCYLTLQMLPVNPVQSLPGLIAQIIAGQYYHKLRRLSSKKNSSFTPPLIRPGNADGTHCARV